KVLARPVAPKRAQGNKWTVHIPVTDPEWAAEDVAVKDVDEVRLEVDHGSFTVNSSLFAECEVFIFCSERPGRGEGPGFVAEGERRCRCKCRRIPEWRGEGVETAFVRLGNSRNHIYSRASGKFASA